MFNFGIESRVQNLETNLTNYEGITRTVISKLEASLDRITTNITESNQMITNLLTKHDERIQNNILEHDQLDKRIENLKNEIRREIDAINKQFETVEKTVESLKTPTLINAGKITLITSIITGLVVAIIGFYVNDQKQYPYESYPDHKHNPPPHQTIPKELYIIPKNNVNFGPI